jgi:hypothetical protein
MLFFSSWQKGFNDLTQAGWPPNSSALIAGDLALYPAGAVSREWENYHARCNFYRAERRDCRRSFAAAAEWYQEIVLGLKLEMDSDL